MNCPQIFDPDNGMINCSLGDDGVPSYEDACSFICNTGYELSGSDTRICQSDGSWSGSDDMCGRGMKIIYCCIAIDRENLVLKKFRKVDSSTKLKHTNISLL